VVATYGRGFWILDDITAIQQLTPDLLASDDYHLFEPRPAYRFLRRESQQSTYEGAQGTNPDYGATLHFAASLQQFSPTIDLPDQTAQISVRDGNGDTIRTLSAPVRPGINRVVWDLQEEPSRTPKLRTPSLEHDHVEFNGSGWRGPPEGGRVRPLAPPGQYTVDVKIGDWNATTELEVLKDPNAEGSLADIQAQVATVRALRDETDQVTDLIDEIEWVRKGLDDVEARIEDDALQLRGVASDSVATRAEALDNELIEIEMLLFDLRLTGGTAGQDSLRWPRQLYAKLISLAGYISGTDYKPTDQAVEVHELYQDQLRVLLERMDGVRSGPLAAFNRLLAEGGAAPIS